MKSKISYSSFATILTTVLSLALIGGCLINIHEKPAFYTILGLSIIVLFFALLYGVVSLKADADHITMVSPLKKRTIPIRNIASVELFQPTLGAVRIFASGGFMGYWGIFKEDDIGRYYAFYGKASDCFLVRLHNGDKYLLGCVNPSTMVDYIQTHIK